MLNATEGRNMIILDLLVFRTCDQASMLPNALPGLNCHSLGITLTLKTTSPIPFSICIACRCTELMQVEGKHLC